MAADDISDVSARCLRYKNMDFPLLDYMVAYLKNKYDKETNPQVKYFLSLKIEKFLCKCIWSFSRTGNIVYRTYKLFQFLALLTRIFRHKNDVVDILTKS